MDQQEKLSIKFRLKRWALDHLEQRIATTRKAMQQAQEAANSEEKSSAGDKYETGRAMGHLQKEMYAGQLAELMQVAAGLHAVNIDVLYLHGKTGALIRTDTTDFFISIGLGKQVIDGRTVVFVSPLAPLTKTLESKHPGDLLVFGKESMPVREIF